MDDQVKAECEALLDPVATLYASLRKAEQAATDDLAGVDAGFLPSARNLVHYLALRQHDLRDLQDRLAAVGLSSLGRAEASVESTLAAVLDLLFITINKQPPPQDRAPATTLAKSRARLAQVTDRLFGPPRDSRRVRILVTLASDAGQDPAVVRDLMKAGMDAARINCAHDDATVWSRMIDHVRSASAELGTACRVIMDLAGPKLRTGALAPGPQVARVKPKRDLRGRVTAVGSVWLTSQADAPPPEGGALTVPVKRSWIEPLVVGDTIRLTDARGLHRSLEVRSRTPTGALVETLKSVYFETGRKLRHHAAETAIGPLPALEQPVVLRPGDTLLVVPEGVVTQGLHVTCTMPAVFADVRPGQRIWFDDGNIGGRVAAATPELLTVTIVEARPTGSKLRADKGINLPDTDLKLPPLNEKDQADLAFAAAHADAVGYSFVRTASDVLDLQQRLKSLGHADLGIMLKIETRQAFENLPMLLLAGMRLPALSVMIARGDLAVECGWERLAELQEEILWVCEAAQVPVVWATQVLESLAKDGRPSRAEITDAAMGERAECVMLNKGAHVVQAVEVLDSILRRMEGHQAKKRSMLRPLSLAQRFAAQTGIPAANAKP